MEDLREENSRLRLELNYFRHRTATLENASFYQLGEILKSMLKNPLKLVLAPLILLPFFAKVIARALRRKYAIVTNKFLNRFFPSNKIAFACNMGLVGGAERVMQKHVMYASEEYDCEVVFQKAEGPVVDELRKHFPIRESWSPAYKLLRYKFVYIALNFPNIRFIKQVNPKTRVCFIIHDHLSGWLEAFSVTPDALLLDHVFCISKLIKDKFLEKVPWFPQDRVSVLYNPMFNGNNDLSQVKLKSNESNNFVLGYLGRVSPEKNTLGLVRIFKEFHKTHKSTKLLIAGPIHENVPEYEQEFKKEIENCEFIKYIGKVGGEGNMPPLEFFNQIDGLAFTSFVEGIPLTAAEAMSFGVPVISTNVGAVNEIVEEGKNGYLSDIEPLSFNPFVELKPPFKSLTKADIQKYLDTLDKFVKTKWNNKAIAELAISRFGDESSKKRLLSSIKAIIAKDPIPVS